VRVVLLGPPGAGKGTQAILLAERFGIPHVATGDLLRAAVAAGTELGRKAKSYMDAGELVPDELVLELLRRRLSEEDARAGFVMDGFPRNVPQAKALDKILDKIDSCIDCVAQIDIPDEIIILRLSSRFSCPTCGRTYNLFSNPPKVEGICDRDGTLLFQREDDRPEVIQHRLEIYHRETAPVSAYYEARGLLRHVEGIGDVEQVNDRIVEAVKGAAA
jgi:adenylate kinase